MRSERPNLFFHAIDAVGGFEPRGDGAPGISIKVLSSDLDTDRKRGSRTRLLRLDPGTSTPEAHARDYWEEIYMLEGEMTVHEDGQVKTVGPHTYAARKPGVMHGPVSSKTGCLMIDFCWYESGEDK
jgi:quercetin dioxygenase-like cupin family protein